MVDRAQLVRLQRESRPSLFPMEERSALVVPKRCAGASLVTGGTKGSSERIVRLTTTLTADRSAVGACVGTFDEAANRKAGWAQQGCECHCWRCVRLQR